MKNENLIVFKFFGWILIIYSIISIPMRILFPISAEEEKQMGESFLPLWEHITLAIMSFLSGGWMILRIRRLKEETKNDSRELSELKEQKIASIIFLGAILFLWFLSITGENFSIRGYFVISGVTVIGIGWFFLIKQLYKKQLFKESNSQSLKK